MIFIIDDDKLMVECIARVIKKHSPSISIRCFSDGISAIQEVDEKVKLIFLDILLDGPDGFTFLNELMSYEDTAKIPIVIVTSLDIKNDLSSYGVVGIMNKSIMKPDDIKYYLDRYVGETRSS